MAERVQRKGAAARASGTPELRRALQASVAQSLRTMTLWIGGLFLLFAPLDALVSGPHGDALAVLDLAIGALFLGIHLLIRRGLIRDGSAHTAMGVAALAVLPYLTANLLITQDPVQSAGWALWQVGLSMLVLSWPWLIGLLAASNVLWAALALRMPPSPAWAQYIFILAGATAISIVAHGVRLRNIRHLEGLRITERLHREQLERAQRTAHEVQGMRQANEAKTRFINTAAHELSTPMTPIVLQVRMLQGQDTSNLTERQRNSLAILGRNVARLNTLLHDVLDSARLQSDRFLMEKAPTDLARILAEAAADYEASAREAGVTLRLDAPISLTVQADPKRLAQVVGNLLNNAVKFTPGGGTVTLAAESRAGQVRVTVADTGIGIPAENVGLLFQPFAQVHDRKLSNVPGTGLGLYISRGIVEHHGGAIGCESAGPGKGATFWFTLPA
ncbi:MAG TPA: HAMP domain-containing sensor histidine kinase [Candidatus Thermoplasmatota archaeon]|nr:HAMP domain-containing sensor histidine kinase [Candidatus Thermoplasmatota archaeon]